MARPIGGILFGIAFWTVSRKVRQHTIKDYLVISAYGIVLLFVSNQASNLIFAPYPPFGLVTVSFVVLASYMLLIGIYSSALSVSQDSELRKIVRKVAIRESKLLDSIGSAELEQEIIMRVMPLLHSQANNIKEETGIESSLTDEDIKQYLGDVLTEVRKLDKK
jgi:hypothetical protein